MMKERKTSGNWTTILLNMVLIRYLIMNIFITGGDSGMNLQEVKKKYKDEWVLVEVLEEDKSGNPIDVRLLKHSKNRDETYAAMKKFAERYTYHFYTGDIPDKGYAVAF